MPRCQSESDSPVAPEDPSALGLLLESLRPRICGILCRYQIPEADAEDVLQETCLLLVLRNHQIRNPRAWFLATLANRCRIYWRSTHRERRRSVSLTAVEDEGASGGQRSGATGKRRDGSLTYRERGLLRYELSAALRELPRRHAILLVLHLVLGYSKEEAAGLLGFRPASAGQTLRRACRFLRARLKAP